MSRTPGRGGTGDANRRMLNAPCGTPNAFSTPYPTGQNPGEVSMLSDSVGWTGNATYNLGLPGIQDIWGTGTSTTSVYNGATHFQCHVWGNRASTKSHSSGV